MAVSPGHRTTEDPPKYTVAFDFPDVDGPWFPVFMHDGSPGITPQLRYADRFDSEEVAQRFLDNTWGPHMRKHGVVVEIGRE